MSAFPLKILVLEDHAFQRAFAVSALRKLGCAEVFEASDGLQALEILKEVGAVDVVLCDLQMEGMDGLEFLYRVAESTLVRSVVISSTLPLELRRSVQKITLLLGMHLLGDIGKPFNTRAMEQLLRKYVSNSWRAPYIHQPAGELETEAEVRRAFAAKEFVPYFQPKFHLKTGEIIGVEVLARWLHPTKGLIAPSSFISVLERCNLMEGLFFDQLSQSLALQKQALQRGHTLNFAINMQSALLANGELHARIRSHIEKHSLHGSRLTFELTESTALDINPLTLGNLVRLRMLGCRLSIDDFGCAHSSLKRLYELPFNEIKVDSGFVRRLKSEPRCRTIISSTLALGESLGMSVVIEGIETAEQRQQLLELGCTLGQGYLYAKPMDGADLLRWLDTKQHKQTNTW